MITEKSIELGYHGYMRRLNTWPRQVNLSLYPPNPQKEAKLRNRQNTMVSTPRKGVTNNNHESHVHLPSAPAYTLYPTRRNTRGMRKCVQSPLVAL